MDSTHFERLTRLVSAGSSRRGFLKGLLAPAAAAALVAVPLLAEDADAKKKRRRRHHRNHDNDGNGGNDVCLADGALCGEFADDRDASCCTKKTGRICAQALNASNSDTTCCGGEGATCGGDNEDLDDVRPYCCQGFVCSTDGLGTGQRGTCLRDTSSEE